MIDQEKLAKLLEYVKYVSNACYSTGTARAMGMNIDIISDEARSLLKEMGELE